MHWDAIHGGGMAAISRGVKYLIMPALVSNRNPFFNLQAVFGLNDITLLGTYPTVTEAVDEAMRHSERRAA